MCARPHPEGGPRASAPQPRRRPSPPRPPAASGSRRAREEDLGDPLWPGAPHEAPRARVRGEVWIASEQSRDRGKRARIGAKKKKKKEKREREKGGGRGGAAPHSGWGAGGGGARRRRAPEAAGSASGAAAARAAAAAEVNRNLTASCLLFPSGVGV